MLVSEAEIVVFAKHPSTLLVNAADPIVFGGFEVGRLILMSGFVEELFIYLEFALCP